MTSPDDAPNDAHREDPSPGDSGVPLDEEAAWRAIVENYGERAVLEPPTRETHRPAPGHSGVERAQDERSAPSLDPGHSTEPPIAPSRRAADVPGDRLGDSLGDSLGDAGRTSSSDHEHFVPPDPPPLPKPTPARRLAWSGLFVPPVLMLLAVVFAWTFPMWFSLALVASFVGGFVFLVVTMPNGEGEDSDDGAVL